MEIKNLSYRENIDGYSKDEKVFCVGTATS